MSSDFKQDRQPSRSRNSRPTTGQRYPWPRYADELTDEDLLREVMNTVGKAGKLGEGVRCVVSVSMLTEGWDANTVTHILGVRAFGTQLLCEQVVGRGLRRMSYAPDDDGMFAPEYAEVYGVPFSFIPTSGAGAEPPRPKSITRVRALESRRDLEITFPRLVGYRYDIPNERLTATFGDDSRLVLSTQDVPTKVENAPIVGEANLHTLDDLKNKRDQEVAFLLAKHTLERYFLDDEGCGRPDLFPQVLALAKRWLAECVVRKDGAFNGLLLLHERAGEAAAKLYRGIVTGATGEPRLKPILRPYDPIGTTRYVDFDTTKPTYDTRADKCPISHIVADTDSWEQKMAQVLEDMPGMLRYVKNQNLGFTIPYTLDGDERAYTPDFIAVFESGGETPIHLVLEVTGEKRRDKEAKVATARDLWVPAVNAHGGLGRWAFVEITDPWNAVEAIREAVD